MITNSDLSLPIGFGVYWILIVLQLISYSLGLDE